MGALYNGDAILNGNLKINSDKPLDSGSVVQNAQALTTLDNNLYNGKLVVALEERTIYLLIDKTKANSLKDGWVKVTQVTINGGESSGGDSGEGGEGGGGEVVIPDNIDELIEKAVKQYLEQHLSDAVKESITIEDEVTEKGSNPVKSSGIFKAITSKVDAKFVVLSEKDYNDLNPKDPKTFYFITK